jgi:DtxR family transcriptional regulator, Mn-dependent transcriptional regulator
MLGCGVHSYTVDVEADRLGHDLSNELTERLALALGNPTVDPHGEPIPAVEGKFQCRPDQSLVDIAIGQRVILSRIADHTPELLNYFAEVGLRPGVKIRVLNRSPLDDRIMIQIDALTDAAVLSSQVAHHVAVQLTLDR